MIGRLNQKLRKTHSTTQGILYVNINTPVAGRLLKKTHNYSTALQVSYKLGNWTHTNIHWFDFELMLSMWVGVGVYVIDIFNIIVATGLTPQWTMYTHYYDDYKYISCIIIIKKIHKHKESPRIRSTHTHTPTLTNTIPRTRIHIYNIW